MPAPLSAKKNPYKTTAAGNVTFSIGAEAANVITVACQVKGQRLGNAAERVYLKWFLSDDADGDSLVATAPDGGVAGGANGWVSATVTGKRGEAMTESNGTLTVTITHAAGAKTVYLGIVLPDGTRVMSGAVTFAA